MGIRTPLRHINVYKIVADVILDFRFFDLENGVFMEKAAIVSYNMLECSYG